MSHTLCDKADLLLPALWLTAATIVSEVCERAEMCVVTAVAGAEIVHDVAGQGSLDCHRKHKCLHNPVC